MVLEGGLALVGLGEGWVWRAPGRMSEGQVLLVHERKHVPVESN